MRWTFAAPIHLTVRADDAESARRIVIAAFHEIITRPYQGVRAIGTDPRELDLVSRGEDAVIPWLTMHAGGMASASAPRCASHGLQGCLYLPCVLIQPLPPAPPSVPS